MKHKKLFLIFVALATIAVCWFVTSQGQIVMDTQPAGVSYTLTLTVFDSNSPWRLYGTAPDQNDIYVYQDGTSGARATNAPTDRGQFSDVVLTAAEMTANNYVIVEVNDIDVPKLYGDTIFMIPVAGLLADVNSTINEFYDYSVDVNETYINNINSKSNATFNYITDVNTTLNEFYSYQQDVNETYIYNTSSTVEDINLGMLTVDVNAADVWSDLNDDYKNQPATFGGLIWRILTNLP